MIKTLKMKKYHIFIKIVSMLMLLCLYSLSCYAESISENSCTSQTNEIQDYEYLDSQDEIQDYEYLDSQDEIQDYEYSDSQDEQTPQSEAVIDEQQDYVREIKIVVYGDSIAWGQVSVGKLNNRTDNHWPKLFGDLSSSLVINNALPSTCLALGNGYGMTDYYNSQAFCNRVDREDLSEFEYIMIAYGTNDYGFVIPMGDDTAYTKGTFMGALNYVINKISSEYPDLKIIMLTPMYAPSSQEKNLKGYTMYNYVEAIKLIAFQHNVAVIDMHNSMGIDIDNYRSFYWDSLHPTEETYALMAEYIKKEFPGMVPSFEEALVAAKNIEKAELEKLLSDKSDTEYDAVDWIALTETIRSGYDEIDAATTIQDVYKAGNAAVERVSNIKTKIEKAEEAEEAINAAEWYGTVGSIPKVRSVTAIAGKKSVKVIWKKATKKDSKKFDKVEIQICPDRNYERANTKRVIVKKSAKSRRVKGLARKTTYYVRVRNVKGSGATKIVSKWSKFKKVKTK